MWVCTIGKLTHNLGIHYHTSSFIIPSKHYHVEEEVLKHEQLLISSALYYVSGVVVFASVPLTLSKFFEVGKSLEEI